MKTVHPHGCGEHIQYYVFLPCHSGSSPRVWGTLRAKNRQRHRARFIPTGVGNMPEHLLGWRWLAVHPHGCGEHNAAHAFHLPHAGSSPRVWGTLNSRKPTSSSFAVHPHGCGEHQYYIKQERWVSGSSPRVWGTCGKAGISGMDGRFIPTGVGNMRRGDSQSSAKPVHPHGCGEHDAKRISLDRAIGSSPRVWGTYTAEGSPDRRRRFIPTGVGNTADPWTD